MISTAVPVASLYGYGQYRYSFEQYRNKIEQNKKPDDFQTSSRKHIDKHEVRQYLFCEYLWFFQDSFGYVQS